MDQLDSSNNDNNNSTIDNNDTSNNEDTMNNETNKEANTTLYESITNQQRTQKTPIAVPYTGQIEPEVVYKSSSGKWKMVEIDTKPVAFDPSTLPKAGSKRIRKPRTTNGYAESLTHENIQSSTLTRHCNITS